MSPKTAIDPQKLVVSALLVLAVVALGGASCDKKSAANPGEAKDVVVAMDNAHGHSHGGTAAPRPAPPPPDTPVNRDPIPGVDISKLDAQKTDRFYRLVDSSLQSPCGKPHSLRTSLTEDSECKRAPFAARYVITLLSDEASNEEIKHFYDDRYKAGMPIYSFQLSDSVPHSGPTDAAVKLVEFFDYGCPSCKHFAPILQEAVGEYPNDAVVYYKNYPLPSHPDSGPAAQAALAAQAQGKYHEMHALLFANAPRHKMSDLLKYAQSLGLDMKKFETDFQAAAPRVRADVAEGNAARVHGTPALFINGREYHGPMHPTYLRLWIEEELAVNR